MNGKTCLNFKLCQSNLSLYLSSLYKLFVFICLEFKKDRLCWKILPTSSLQCCCSGVVGWCLMQHAQRCVESHWCFSQHSQRRSLLCQGPDLRHLRGCSVVLGSAPSSGAFQLNRGVKPGGGLSPSQKNICENPGNKCVVSIKGGLGCWSCQCYNCEALLKVTK